MPAMLAVAIIWLTAKLLRLMAPPFSKLVGEQARREGHYRFVHSRLIQNAEEVAFYGISCSVCTLSVLNTQQGGHRVESSIINNAYISLVKVFTVPLSAPCVLALTPIPAHQRHLHQKHYL